MQHYTAPKPAPLPADFDEFYAELTPQEKKIHELAIEKLVSSYFVQDSLRGHRLPFPFCYKWK